MKHLQRMLDSSETDAFEYRLLQTAANECPAPELVTAWRMSLGVPATALTRLATISAWKVTLLAVSMGALLGLRDTQPPRRAAVASPDAAVELIRTDSSAPKLATAQALDAVTSPIAASAAASVTMPNTTNNAAEGPRARATERARASAGPDLREEIRLMDAARSAIRSRQAQAALDALDRYATRFHAGAFKQEAAVLKIQALSLRGETARANSMAKQFVKDNPKSPYVDQASRIVERSGGTGP